MLQYLGGRLRSPGLLPTVSNADSSSSPKHAENPLDLRGALPGKWTVRVTNPDTQYAELYNGFTVNGLVFLPLILRNR